MAPPTPSKKVLQRRAAKQVHKFHIDCEVLTTVDEPANLESFLIQKIKVNGKAGAIQGVVKVTRDKTKITVEAKGPFSKRYLKYLTKKYLKKHKLRDYFHVIASAKDTYEIRHFNINVDDEEEDKE